MVRADRRGQSLEDLRSRLRVDNRKRGRRLGSSIHIAKRERARGDCGISWIRMSDRESLRRCQPKRSQCRMDIKACQEIGWARSGRHNYTGLSRNPCQYKYYWCRKNYLKFIRWLFILRLRLPMFPENRELFCYSKAVSLLLKKNQFIKKWNFYINFPKFPI